ncbi:hypothetical protein MBLNU459_g0769t1 [Dothideomycetes sp. NU459]
MPSYDCPSDEDGTTRQTYNFAPGSHGLVYRAEVPDHGAGGPPKDHHTNAEDKITEADTTQIDGAATAETKYKLQAMKWGLIPFWTKRAPEYGGMLKTINCRDDSLAQPGGMWNTMKQRKRCIIVCEGFYEWLKKNNGREKIPHFVKRKDGQLLCLAGLWDCVKYEGQDEKLYTYSIITTDSNKQLKFLHDRMPVILENGSDAMKTWLDPGRSEWSKELQALLKPYDGELECYPVDRAVGKVGNNSPSFVVPIDSKENKKNIANFFGNQKCEAQSNSAKHVIDQDEKDVKTEDSPVKQEPDEDRETTNRVQSTEDNAPLPKPKHETDRDMAIGVKRELLDDEPHAQTSARKLPKTEENKPHLKSPERAPPARKIRSATSNGTQAKTPSKAADGSQKITNFFNK